MALVEGRRRTRVAGSSVGAGDHAEEGSGLVTGLAARDGGGHGCVTSDVKRRRIDVRRTELEAAGVDVGRGMAARAVAVEAADRNVVVTGPADDRYGVGRWRSGERSGARAMALQAARHALVDAGHRVACVVSRVLVALGTGCRSWDVVCRLAIAAIEVAREGGRGGMAAAAVAGGRVGRVVLGRPVIALSAHGGADHHAEVLRALVTGLARRDRTRHGGVARTIERRASDVGRAELEAARVDVASRVAARAVAVEAADRDVVVPGPAGDGYRVRRWRSRERSGARTMTAQAARDALVCSGHRVLRVVARGRMALGAGRRGRDV